MTLYKLTDSNGTTKGGTKWKLGKTVTAKGVGKPKLCTDTVLHAYTSPLLAAFMNPVHGAFKRPLGFTVEGEIAVTDGTKTGSMSLTVTGTFDVPAISINQAVAFGILCSLQVYKDDAYSLWASNWLTGSDRSLETANRVCVRVTNPAAGMAIYAAQDAAVYAAKAVYVATYAAYAANAAYAAHTAVCVATYAAYATDFQAIAEKAMQY